MPYRCCDVMTISYQFLAQKIIEEEEGGGSPVWAEVPSFSDTNGCHKGPSRKYVNLCVLEASSVVSGGCAQKVKIILSWGLSLNADCDAPLSPTALRSLLPAARSALGGNEAPEWIKQRRTMSHHKTRRRTKPKLGLGVANNKLACNPPPCRHWFCTLGYFLFRNSTARQAKLTVVTTKTVSGSK